MTEIRTSDAVRIRFRQVYGDEPDAIWAAPGRVNLMGEHTDYNDGFVLPIALQRTVKLAVRHRDDGALRLHSAQDGGGVTELQVAHLKPGATQGWGAYLAGVVWALAAAGHTVGGADVHIDSDVPTGAGLSSSAALECAMAVAYDAHHRLGIARPDLARLAQRAENAYVGVPCGIMDQTASLCCDEGSALFVDTRDLSQRQVPVDLTAHGAGLLVIDTRVQHELIDSGYAERRAGCEQACAALGVRALRDVPDGELDAVLPQLPEGLRPLVRHVVTENDRVRQTVALLESGDVAGLGPVLTAGHTSLRDDYRVSWREADLAVDAALRAGALGARMTGGGFGGSVIALVRLADADPVSAAVEKAFRTAGSTPPRIFPALPSAGARRLADRTLHPE